MKDVIDFIDENKKMKDVIDSIKEVPEFKLKWQNCFNGIMSGGRLSRKMILGRIAKYNQHCNQDELKFSEGELKYMAGLSILELYHLYVISQLIESVN